MTGPQHVFAHISPSVGGEIGYFNYALVSRGMTVYAPLTHCLLVTISNNLC